MERENIINKIKELLKLRHYMPNEYDEKEAREIYNQYVEQSLERGTYDGNVFKQETLYIIKFSGASDIEDAITIAKVTCKKYIEEGYKDVKWVFKWWQIEIIGRRLIPFEDFFNKKISNIRFQKIHTPEYNIASMLHKELGINESQIRNIYIKLLLEEKISIEDFKQLCSSTNSSIDLYEFIKGDEPTKEL